MDESNLCIDEYWGPFQFREPEENDEQWGALLLGGRWRWMDLYGPSAPDAPYTMGAQICSAYCRDRRWPRCAPNPPSAARMSDRRTPRYCTR
jgi:hypothetical protein